MLTIREEQLKALGDGGRAEFAREMAPRLRGFFPGALDGCSEELLLEKIGEALDRAADLELERRMDVAHYLNLCVAAGWKLEGNPKFVEIWRALEPRAGVTAGERVAEACGRMQQWLELQYARAEAMAWLRKEK